MKILMVLDGNFPPDIRVEHEIISLIQEGHQVHLACYTKTNLPLKEEWNGAIIYRKKISDFIHKTSVGCLKFPFYFNFWRSFVFDLCNTHKYDVIHVHDLPLAQIGMEAKQKFGLFFILDLHENWPALLTISKHVKGFLGKFLSSDKQWRAYEKEMIQKADHVIVVVEEAQQRVKNISGNSSKISVISNTPVLKELEILQTTYETKNKELTLFYGGGVTEHRGLQVVIQSLTKLKDKKIKLSIVGDGSYLGILKKMTKDLHLEDKVEFHGWMSLKEMTLVMLKSDVLLIPHKKSEHTDSTIPHKLFQYMLTGKPILSTNCIPLERIVKETESGYIYDYYSLKSFEEEVTNIYAKWIENKNLKMNGASYVMEQYNWSIDEKVLIGLYSKEYP